MTSTQKKTLQFSLAIMGGLFAAALIASQPVKAADKPFIVDHSDYDYALSDSQRECRVTHPADANGGTQAFEVCVRITMHDRYGFGTLPEPAQPEVVPAGITPWGVYRDTPGAAQALGAAQ